MKMRDIMHLVEGQIKDITTDARGECFAYAWKQFTERRADGEPVTLVHALVTMDVPGSTKKPYWHAWVEDADRVYDWQTMEMGASKYQFRGWPKQEFYDFFHPRQEHRYVDPVGKLLRKFGHYGPWITPPTHRVDL